MQPVLAEDLRLGCRSETVVAGSRMQAPAGEIVGVCLVSYDASALLCACALRRSHGSRGYILGSKHNTAAPFQRTCFDCEVLLAVLPDLKCE